MKKHVDAIDKRIIVATMVLLAPIIFLLISPDIESEESICPFMRYVGIPCPGCGLTKSIICAYTGRLGKSFAYHPFGIAIVGMATLTEILCVYDKKHKTYLSDKLLNNSLLWNIFPWSFLIFYSLRLFFSINHLFR